MNQNATIVHNAAWASIGQNISFLLKFFSGIYLARTIDPHFFGQQGLALSIVALFWTFVTIGEQPAIIRLKENVEAYTRMILSIRLVFVAVITTIFSFAWFVGWCPGSSIVRSLIVVLFVVQIPSQLSNIYITYMTKRMMFCRIAIINIISSCVAVITACVMAYSGHHLQALLWLVITEQLCAALLTFILTPIRFLPKFDRVLAIDFFHYAKYIFPLTQIDRLQGKIPDISIGTIVGETSLSFYQRAVGLGSMFQMMLMGGLSEFIQSHLSGMQDDRARMGRHFEFVSSVLMRLTLAAFLCISLILPFLIELIYGPKWLKTVTVFQLLLPFAILQTIRVFLRNTHLVVGSVRHLTYAQIAEFCIILLLIYPATKLFDMIGAAAVLSMSIMVSVSMMLFYLKHYAVFSIRRIFLNPAIASGISIVMIYLTGFVNTHMDLLRAVSVTIIFGSVYFGTLLVIERQFLAESLNWFTQALRPSKESVHGC
jgi:O-antigen/teichoic acid export membrane protein